MRHVTNKRKGNNLQIRKKQTIKKSVYIKKMKRLISSSSLSRSRLRLLLVPINYCEYYKKIKGTHDIRSQNLTVNYSQLRK